MTAKALIRDVIADTLSALNVYKAVLNQKNRWLILTFHRVLPASIRDLYPLPNLAVTPAELAWIIDALKPYFDIKTVSDAARHWQAQDNTAPMLSITFDDGQWDNVEYALPVLKEKSVAATFYLPTDFINTERLLWHDEAAFAWRVLSKSSALQQQVLSLLSDADQATLNMSTASSFVSSLKLIEPTQRQSIIKSLLTQSENDVDWARMMTWLEAERCLAQGHEIASHGKSHNLLPQQSVAAQQDELTASKADIEQRLKCSVLSFCYPNGDYDMRTLDLLKNGGYDNAVTTLWGVNKKSTPAFELLRCDMNPFLLTDRKGRLSTNRLLMRLCGFQLGNGR